MPIDEPILLDSNFLPIGEAERLIIPLKCMILHELKQVVIVAFLQLILVIHHSIASVCRILRELVADELNIRIKLDVEALFQISETKDEV